MQLVAALRVGVPGTGTGTATTQQAVWTRSLIEQYALFTLVCTQNITN